MATPLPEDVAYVWEIIADNGGANADEIAYAIVAALKGDRRLLPAGVTDTRIYYEYRWRNPRTGEVQEALHASHDPKGWVQDRRRCVRARSEYEEIT